MTAAVDQLARLGALTLAVVASHAHAGVASGEGGPSGAPAGSAPILAESKTSSAAALAGGPNYYHVLGSALKPRNSANTYAYTSNGCIFVNGGPVGDRLQFPVLLPDGVFVRSLRLYVNDTSASNLTAWLTRYSPGQSSSDIVAVASAGSSGIGSFQSVAVTHEVDNADAYVINLAWSVNDSSLQVCGVRVEYYGPLVFSDGFEG